MSDEAPDPPTGVWVEYLDGERYEDLPVFFEGFDVEGLAVYDVLYPHDKPAVAVGMSRLPGRTTIKVPMIVPRP